MAKPTAKMVEQMRAQMRNMTKGVIIDNKSFSSMRMRILPTFSAVPGVEYVSLYYVSGKKSTTSPLTYGIPDPVIDMIDEAGREMSKDEMEQMRSIVRIQREYWMPVVDRKDMGTPENPNVRIFRAKRTAYQQIVDYMIDEDEEDGGEDITDPVEGRDIRVKKSGKDLSTEWNVKVLDRSAIADDDAMTQALIKVAQSFDVRRYFYRVDRDLLQAIYTHLTGEAIPKKYITLMADLPASEGKSGGGGTDGDDDDDAPVSPEGSDDDDAGTEADASVQGGDAAAVGTEAEIEVGATVSFEYESQVIVGVVQQVAVDEDGDTVADVQPEDGPVYTVTVNDLTIVPPPAEPEQEPEQETEEKKTVLKKGPKVQMAAKSKPSPKIANKGTAVKAGSAASTLKAKIAAKTK